MLKTLVFSLLAATALLCLPQPSGADSLLDECLELSRRLRQSADLATGKPGRDKVAMAVVPPAAKQVAAVPLPPQSLALSHRVPPRCRPYWNWVRSYAGRYGVDPLLVVSVMKHESAYRPFAVSRAGAMGLMQLMPGTAAEMGVSDCFDPQQNIRGGVRYLGLMLRRFNGDVVRALMAYNAGPERVERRRIPEESRRYARDVMRYYRKLTHV